ncbi:MAG: peptidase [Rhodospirillales bacterium]|nr:peptidase [Rhodospirillales bacterium]
MRLRVLAAAAVAAGFHTTTAQAGDVGDVLATYTDIAHAAYEDSLIRARELDVAIDTLIAAPTDANMARAREAWVHARVPYQQTEAYRFGNAMVDDWEGLVNAWPLDEGLIDYVDGGYGDSSDANMFHAANVIANPTLQIGGVEVDASTIDADLLDSLHEIDGVEANVSRGYHAIEFLLWGQDLNGTDAGAGNRAATDYDTRNCTNGNCDRRAAYLKAASDLLVSDLEDAVAMWANDGDARANVMDAGDEGGLAIILTGMGSLSYGELAGERMQLGLLLHDPEEEHDCFSDNTHWSHYYDIVSIQNVYLGTYTRIDGSVVSGTGVSDLVAEADAEVDAAMRGALNRSLARAMSMVTVAEAGKSYDQMLAEGDEHGNRVIRDVIDALKEQTTQIEVVVATLGLGSLDVEGSDSLDDPNAVFR